MRLFLVVILMSSFSFLDAQSKQDYYWPFGVRTRTFEFDFNNQPFNPTTRQDSIHIDQMNASICNKEGELLFYTNGCSIINRLHQVMPNGDSINEVDFMMIDG